MSFGFHRSWGIHWLAEKVFTSYRHSLELGSYITLHGWMTESLSGKDVQDEVVD